MLTTGDMDDNVHMANTMRLADALIKANKRFDMFVFPGLRHGYMPEAEYVFWMRAELFLPLAPRLVGDRPRRSRTPARAASHSEP